MLSRSPTLQEGASSATSSARSAHNLLHTIPHHQHQLPHSSYHCTAPHGMNLSTATPTLFVIAPQPFSMGRNLLCVHSKKHMTFDPSTRSEKMRQNVRTLKVRTGPAMTRTVLPWRTSRDGVHRVAFTTRKPHSCWDGMTTGDGPSAGGGRHADLGCAQRRSRQVERRRRDDAG